MRRGYGTTHGLSMNKFLSLGQQPHHPPPGRFISSRGDGLRGWACRIRTNESVREPPNWFCVTISPKVGVSPAAETCRARAALYGFAAPANSAGDLSGGRHYTFLCRFRPATAVFQRVRALQLLGLNIPHSSTSPSTSSSAATRLGRVRASSARDWPGFGLAGRLPNQISRAS